jgi:arylsulfatase A-like enzyme
MRKTLQVLQDARKRPFFLAVGFHQAHVPLLAPPEYFEPYPLERIALPALYREDLDPWEGRPPLLRKKNLDLFVERPSTPESARQAIQAYYACISHVDDMVGRLLGALHELGLEERTLVVLLSDHGFHLGERGLWAKMTLYEETTRVPLIVSVPGMAPGVAFDPVELVDLYPTLCALCGLEGPPSLQGRSLVPHLREPHATRNGAAYTVLGHTRGVKGRSIRTRRFRYTEWGDGTCELFDHEEDPHEAHNLLWGAQEISSKAARLRERLQEAMERAAGKRS